MSTLTLADVLAADPVPVLRSAIAWSALANDLDNAYEEFLPGLRQVDRGAAGVAAQAAVRRLTEEGRRLSTAVNPARRIADALNRHAYGLDDLHRMIAAIGAEARTHGLHLDAGGRLTAPPTVMKADDPAVWATTVGRLRSELGEILNRARDHDD